MKNLIIFSSLIMTFSAHAVKVGSIKERFDAFNCQKEIKKMETTWGAKGEWKGHIIEDGNLALKRPTDKFANWILLEKSANVEAITLMNPKNAQKISFDSKCNPTMTAYNHHQYSIPKSMDDTKLLTQMVNNKEGIIVMYSPGMNHSWTAIERLQKIGKEQNLPISFVMDPFASEKVAKDEAKKHHVSLNSFEKLSSLELAYRDATMHYPSFFVYKNGAIVGNMIPGLMTEQKYNAAIKKTLGK